MKNTAIAYVFIIMFSATVSMAQSASGHNPRLVIRSGLVEVQRGDIWLPISVGTILNAGDHIRTAGGSRAAVEFGPGQVITLNEQSAIKIGEFVQSGSSVAQLEGGSMNVSSTSDIQFSAKGTVFESYGQPLDLVLGYQGNDVNLTVFNGAVRNGSVIIQGGNQDPTVRTYVADGRSWYRNGNIVTNPNPNFYIYPYVLFGNSDPNDGRIVPPVVNNPTHPGFRPTQIVPPMSDPLRVPVTRP